MYINVANNLDKIKKPIFHFQLKNFKKILLFIVRGIEEKLYK